MADAADLLRVWMLRSELTQLQTAEMLGVAQNTISEWLARRRIPGLRLSDEIHRLTGIRQSAWLEVQRNTARREGRLSRAQARPHKRKHRSKTEAPHG
jgi:transcriptional regulator with XRE-family HTH domain